MASPHIRCWRMPEQDSGSLGAFAVVLVAYGLAAPVTAYCIASKFSVPLTAQRCVLHDDLAVATHTLTSIHFIPPSRCDARY